MGVAKFQKLKGLAILLWYQLGSRFSFHPSTFFQKELSKPEALSQITTLIKGFSNPANGLG